MPVATRTLEIPLPKGVELTDVEAEHLTAVGQAVLAFVDQGRSWQAVRDSLKAQGWDVTWRIGCCAEARRGREYERAFGCTPDDAFAELLGLTSLDTEPEP